MCKMRSEAVSNEQDLHLAAFVNALAQQDRPIRGRKALHKLMYLAQIQGWPATFDYRLHLFGPYSDDLAGALMRLEAAGAIRIDLDNSIAPNPQLEQMAANVNLSAQARDALERVAHDLRDDDPRSLELLATVAYMAAAERRLHRHATNHQVLRRVQRYKGPKYSLGEIEAALRRLRDLRYPVG